jgi:hypothetical protein
MNLCRDKRHDFNRAAQAIREILIRHRPNFSPMDKCPSSAVTSLADAFIPRQRKQISRKDLKSCSSTRIGMDMWMSVTIGRRW